MKHVEGVQLQQMWPKMAASQKIQCIGHLYHKIMEIAALDFPAYGSLYHNMTGNKSTRAMSLDAGFCVGPHCGGIYWDCNPMDPRYYHDATPNHGPCRYIRIDVCDSLTGFKGLVFTNTAMA